MTKSELEQWASSLKLDGVEFYYEWKDDTLFIYKTLLTNPRQKLSSTIITPKMREDTYYMTRLKNTMLQKIETLL